MPDQDPTSVFSRPKVPQRGSMTMSQAPVDTTGMDPEMASTLGSMRGALGAGGTPVPAHNAFTDMITHIKGLFGGKGKAK
jgi:hypothetical protein